MWVRVTTDKRSLHLMQPVSFSYIEGNDTEEYYFGDEMAAELERDGFLNEMWEQLDAVLDWGDCDFFPPEKCKIFQTWLEGRLAQRISDSLRAVYLVMLNFTKIAIQNDTGISFDF